MAITLKTRPARVGWIPIIGVMMAAAATAHAQGTGPGQDEPDLVEPSNLYIIAPTPDAMDLDLEWIHGGVSFEDRDSGLTFAPFHVYDLRSSYEPVTDGNVQAWFDRATPSDPDPSPGPIGQRGSYTLHGVEPGRRITIGIRGRYGVEEQHGDLISRILVAEGFIPVTPVAPARNPPRSDQAEGSLSRHTASCLGAAGSDPLPWGLLFVSLLACLRWRARILIAGLVMLPGTAAFAQSSPAWEAVGSSAEGNGVGGSEAPALAVDSQGDIFVTCKATTPDGQTLVVMKGMPTGEWTPVGGDGGRVSERPGLQSASALTLDTQDVPVVAWAHQVGSTNTEILLARWSGDSWEEVAGSGTGGGISATAGYSLNPSIVVAPTGAIIVAWEELNGGPDSAGDIRVRQCLPGGDHWIEVGAGSASGGGVSGSPASASALASITRDGAGRLYLGWIEVDYLYFVRTFDAEQQRWIGLGSPTGLFTTAPSWHWISRPALAASADGQLMAAWLDTPRPDGVFMLDQREIMASRWDPVALAWDAEQNVSRSPDLSSISPALAWSPEGHACLAWSEYLGRVAPGPVAPVKIYARCWAAGEWIELDGSRSGEGVSGNPGGVSTSPAVAFGPDDTTVIAWTEAHPSGSGGVYLRLRRNQAPGGESTQLRDDGLTPLPPAGITFGERQFTVHAAIADPERDEVRVQVQVGRLLDGGDVEYGDVITTAYGASPFSVNVRTPLLPLGSRCVWRTRYEDRLGHASSWWEPSRLPGQPFDAWLRNQSAPSAGSVAQFLAAGGEEIPFGSSLLERDELRLGVVAFDVDGDAVTLLVEVRHEDSPFTGNPTAASDAGPAGGWRYADLALEVGRFHWSYCVEDALGDRSEWQAAPGAMQFRVEPYGSTQGRLACPASPRSAMAGLPLIAFYLLAMAALRRI